MRIGFPVTTNLTAAASANAGAPLIPGRTLPLVGNGVIEVATDTSGWEDWQLEYRFGAFYIFAPEAITEMVDELRRTNDPRSHAICQAHISLSEAIPRTLTHTDLDELGTKLSAVDPFVIHYGPVVSFPPHPGVALAIKPQAEFRSLRDAVHSVGVFERTLLRRQAVPAHLTIAEFISIDRTEELLHELGGRVPEGEFACDRIEYAAPDNSFRFRRMLTIPLGRG